MLHARQAPLRFEKVFELKQQIDGGIIWIGSTNNSLSQYDKQSNRFTHYKYEPGNRFSLSSNQGTALFEDREGYLWNGTEDRG